MSRSIGQWMKNARYGALAQSVMPAVLAAVMAWGQEGFEWWAALLAVVGVAMAHLAMNLADDWFDYRVDMLGDRDKVTRQGFRAMTVKYPYLADGSETLRSTAFAIAQMVVVALACGCVIFWRRISIEGFSGACGAWWIVLIVALCGFMGAFYSAPPFKLAYRGLGELVIGIIFGPLVMMGVWYSACGSMDWGIVLTSIPVGLLVMNILFTHSFIDMKGDAASNKMTFARLLGSNGACLAASAVMIFLPFLLVVLGVCLSYLRPAYLAVLLVLPRGIWLYRSLVLFARGEMMEIEKPAWWLGPMQGWEGIRAAHVDWFLARWFCARNLLSGFCLAAAVAAAIVKFL